MNTSVKTKFLLKSVTNVNTLMCYIKLFILRNIRQSNYQKGEEKNDIENPLERVQWVFGL